MRRHAIRATCAVLCAAALAACGSSSAAPLPSTSTSTSTSTSPSPSPSPAPSPSPSPAPSPSPSPSLATLSPTLALRAASPLTLDGVLDEPDWARAPAAAIDHDCTGAAITAPLTLVRALWTADALFLAFEASFDGTLTAPDTPAHIEHEHLYGYDVVEAFLDADPSTPDTYRELEWGPRGHFLDVDVDRGRRPRGDTAWSSGMEHVARVDEGAHRFVIEARIPAAAFGASSLEPGTWRVGLYRITGSSPAPRAFLARYPTHTSRPNFHVPERFGEIELAP